MKKSSKKGSSIVIILVVAASIILTAGIVKADSLTVDSLTVGKQGVGGVTFFNGTIINNTTNSSGGDNPVTFGDNVRIDGYVYRGANAGINDSQPFKINDNAEIYGNLTIDKNLTITGFLTSDSKIYAEDGLDVTGFTTINGYTFFVGEENETHFGGKVYLSDHTSLATTDGQPPSQDCPADTSGDGRILFETASFSPKLWVCDVSHWVSFSVGEEYTLGNISCSYGQIPQKDVSSWKCVTNIADSVEAFFDCISDYSIGNENIKLSDWNSCKTRYGF